MILTLYVLFFQWMVVGLSGQHLMTLVSKSMTATYGENPNTAIAVNLLKCGEEMNATQALVLQKVHMTSVHQVKTYLFYVQHR